MDISRIPVKNLPCRADSQSDNPSRIAQSHYRRVKNNIPITETVRMPDSRQ